jgi:hypothetical protein
MANRSRLAVVWDVDDVLNDLMEAWFSEWKKTRMTSSDTLEHLTSNPPHELLGISKKDYLESLDAFRRERYRALRPREDVLSWFREFGPRAHHIALSAVPRTYADVSAAWVIRWYGDWIRTFAFVPSLRIGTESSAGLQSKAEYLAWLCRADVFVDDLDGNLSAAMELGIQCVLAPRPWNANRHEPFNSGLDRVSAFIQKHEAHAESF